MSWVVKKIENGQALLANKTEQFRVSRESLPDKIKEGDILNADFYFARDEKKRRDGLAKALLEEIIGKN